MKTLRQFLVENSKSVEAISDDIQIIRIGVNKHLKSIWNRTHLNHLLRNLLDLEKESFYDDPLHPSSIKTLKEIITNTPTEIALAIQKDTIIGSACLSQISLNTFLFYTFTVTTTMQNKGIGKSLVNNLLKPLEGKPMFIEMDTQNPKTYYIIRNYCQVLVPSPEHPIIPKGQYHQDKSFLGGIADDIDLETYILSGYRSRIKEEHPKCNDTTINEWFSTLKPDQAFYCIGQLK